MAQVQTDAPRILIVGPSWVGDMVMTQALCAALQQRYADATIDVLAPSWSASVIDRMPGVNQAIAHELGHGQFHLGRRRQLARQLRQAGYDHAIVIPGSWKSALIPWMARIPSRIGYRREMRYGLLNDCRPLDKKKYPLMIQRLIALSLPSKAATDLAIIEPRLSTQDPVGAMKRHALSNQQPTPILALCPGAEFGVSKQWPAAHFAAVAQAKLALGWQVWLFGSPNDLGVATQINTLCQDRCVNLAGKTNLGDAIDLLSLAALVVTNDSGLMHVACALGRYVVAVYGSTSAAFTPPLSPKARVVSLSLHCQPCFERECPLKHHDCMNTLTPGMVLQASDQLMASSQGDQHDDRHP